ncbi:MAG TPA: glycoside hydrolase domain-containing protein [Gemmatimonadaceae bacterium]|nr:glycoside hydrolase domain-containing protein [Gemmatimonadaceae bacterium]
MKKPKHLLLILTATVCAVLQGPRLAGVRLPFLADAAAGTSAEPIAQLAAAEPPGDTMRAGRHLGFDTHSYPGDAAMRAWRGSGSPYEWVGYYLPAPCHKDDSWSGKRELLAEMGWGVAVIYVGQQTWEGSRPLSRAALSRARRSGGLTCHRSLLGYVRGRADAADAIARTAAEGFAPGTVIFLDVEYMDRVPQAMREYYRAWTERVLADGRYRPGIYAHTRNAEVVYDDVRELYAAAGASEEPPFWVASGRSFSLDKAPHEVGHAFAAVWQGLLDVTEKWNGFRLPIDVNVSAVPSPSSHEYAPAKYARYAGSAAGAPAIAGE